MKLNELRQMLVITAIDIAVECEPDGASNQELADFACRDIVIENAVEEWAHEMTPLQLEQAKGLHRGRDWTVSDNPNLDVRSMIRTWLK